VKSEVRSQKSEVSAFAFVALGSNLGDSHQIVLDAMLRLQNFSGLPILKSSLWRTSPVNCPPDSPPFVNAVVGLVTRAGETPESLLQKLLVLEKEFGRRAKKVLNEPRPLDLDLIVFGTETRPAAPTCLAGAWRRRKRSEGGNTPKLILPHPRAHLRRFVLQPLGEIAPDLILPGQCKTVSQLLAELSSDEVLKRI
jgi:2-amino-4-hydroxy-6-hydroxymethyldihydropteridine diphosphokinase